MVERQSALWTGERFARSCCWYAGCVPQRWWHAKVLKDDHGIWVLWVSPRSPRTQVVASWGNFWAEIFFGFFYTSAAFPPFLAFEVWFDRIILLLIALNSIGTGRSTVDMYMTWDTFGKGTLFNEKIDENYPKRRYSHGWKLGWRAVSGTKKSVVFRQFFFYALIYCTCAINNLTLQLEITKHNLFSFICSSSPLGCLLIQPCWPELCIHQASPLWTGENPPT